MADHVSPQATARAIPAMNIPGEETHDVVLVGAGAYNIGDALGSSVSTTATAVLDTAITAPHNGAIIEIDEIRIHTNKTGLVPRLKLHAYNTSQPTTALVGDNVAFLVHFANRAQRLGSEVMIPLVSQTDGSLVEYKLGSPFRVKCAENSNKIYERWETLDAFTPDAGMTMSVRYKYRVVG